MQQQYPEYLPACRFLRDRRIYLTDGEFAAVRSVTKRLTIPKHTVIMEQGKLVEKLYFLNSGIVRLAREHRGMDFTLGMISSQEFISTPLYLTNGVPSSCSLETLTEVEVLEWGKQEVDFIMKELHHGQEVFWSLMERVMTWVQDNQVDALCLSAEERYQKLMDEQPEVIRDVPVKYIASFLNIHQDSLSRIRKQARQKS